MAGRLNDCFDTPKITPERRLKPKPPRGTFTSEITSPEAPSRSPRGAAGAGLRSRKRLVRWSLSRKVARFGICKIGRVNEDHGGRRSPRVRTPHYVPTEAISGSTWQFHRFRRLVMPLRRSLLRFSECRPSLATRF